MDNKNVEKQEVQYSGISLRREHVENEKLPSINIFYNYGFEEAAARVSYGIEEEGLPFRVIKVEEPMDVALQDISHKGLGVAIGIINDKAAVYCRQFKKDEPFLVESELEAEKLTILGKNGARIIKHKPFIIDNEE